MDYERYTWALVVFVFGTLVIIFKDKLAALLVSPKLDENTASDIQLKQILSMSPAEQIKETGRIIKNYATPSDGCPLKDKLHSIKDRGYFNANLFAFYEKHSELKFNNENAVISAGCFQETVLGGASYLTFGSDSFGDFVYALKKDDSENIYEFQPGALTADTVGSFAMFILLSHYESVIEKQS